MTWLETPEDMAWLAEVHTPLAALYPYAILHGNEDCPTMVELYARNHHKCKPTVLAMDDAGDLQIITLREPARSAINEVLERLNWHYGRGDITKVDFAAQTVTRRPFGCKDEVRRFTLTKTPQGAPAVRFLGHTRVLRSPKATKGA
jgi:hypothetical protein